MDEHRRLRATIEGMSPRWLRRPFGGRKETPGYVIRGIAAHDLYHAGQIQLIKRLQGGRG